MKIQALPNQSIVDIALQYTSTIDTTLDIARANNVPIDYTYTEPADVAIPDGLWCPLNIVPCTGAPSLNTP